MNKKPLSRRSIIFILIGAFGLLFVILFVVSVVFQKDENQYGKFIRIQNYSSKIKNLPSDMRDSMESSLYNTVTKNIEDDQTATKIKDAFIRDGSESQDYVQPSKVYTGEFIIDIESIQQSYLVNYKYLEPSSSLPGGNTVYITCAPESVRKFSSSQCKDDISVEADKTDELFQYLPYQNFSFKLTPDATRDDKVVILAELSIPGNYLTGSTAQKREVVSEFKTQVADWVASKGLSIKDYTFLYNYSDTGEFIDLYPQDTSTYDSH